MTTFGFSIGFHFSLPITLVSVPSFSGEEDGYMPTNICQRLDGNSFKVNYHPEQCD